MSPSPGGLDAQQVELLLDTAPEGPCVGRPPRVYSACA